MKTIEVKLNDYNAPTQLPNSIIELLNEENILLDKIRMVEANKVIIREQILKKEGEALKEQVESMFSKIGMEIQYSTDEVKYNCYSFDVGFDREDYIRFTLEVPTKKNEELSRHPRGVWEYGTELKLFVHGIFKYHNPNKFSEYWGDINILDENEIRRHVNHHMGEYTDFDLNTFMERNFETIKELIVIKNNRIRI
jgi:hypothetical protein